MIYLDNAATTRMFEECLDEYKKWAIDCYYNPSALYAQSLEPLNMMHKVKANIAKKIGCLPEELYFVASGSEADNLSLLCTIKPKKGKVLISSVEHSAIANTAQRLKDLGYEIEFVNVDRYGRVDINDFKSKMTKDTVLVSIMLVCNETGALNPIKELCSLAKRVNPSVVFHCDGVQGFGKVPVNLKNFGVDAFSISSHKIHGPKGVGVVFVKKDIHPRTFIYGGGQEDNIRSATENVPGIAAFNVAMDKTFETIAQDYSKAKEIQKYVYDFVSKNFEDCIINTNLEESSPYIISFSLKNVRGEGVVHYLESRDIVIGTGSACSAKKGLKRIPLALGLDSAYHDGMLRISYDANINKEDLNTALNALKEAIKVERELHKHE